MLRNLPLAAAMVAASLTVVGGFALNGGATSCMLRAKGARSALVDVKGRSRRTSLTMAEDFPASRSRREVLFGLGAAAFLFVAPAESKEAINDCDKWAPGRKYITGKSCQEKGSNEVKGTKKDPKYLRSIQNCRSKCQASVMTGEAKTTNDCLKTCRNEYCTTYEQCTYQIGPKEDYGGEEPFGCNWYADHLSSGFVF